MSAFPFSFENSGFAGLPTMEITVAGTVQVLHLIPFYAGADGLSITNLPAKVQLLFHLSA